MNIVKNRLPYPTSERREEPEYNEEFEYNQFIEFLREEELDEDLDSEDAERSFDHFEESLNPLSSFKSSKRKNDEVGIGSEVNSKKTKTNFTKSEKLTSSQKSSRESEKEKE